MKKVYQTIVDKGKGNCMQAAIASLFELELNDVPNYIEEEDWFPLMISMYSEKGYGFTCFNPWSKNRDVEKVFEILEYDGGVNGFFYATVKSQTYEGVTHAVIVNMKLEVVHDPNPNEKALKLKPEDIIAVDTVRGGWHISIEGNLVKKPN